MSSPPLPSRHDPWQALRHRDYCLLLSAGLATVIAGEAQAVVVGWEIYQRTGSAWMLGLAGLAQFFPVLLFALPAGQLADRFSRKRQYQLAQLAAAACSLLLAWLSATRADPWLFLATLFVAGIARAFSAPARSSLLPQVVPLEVLPNAVAWNSSAWQLSNIGGPALGGLLLAVAPPWAAYLVGAGGGLLCALLLAPIGPREGIRFGAGRGWAGLTEGLGFVFSTPLLLSALALDLFAVLLGGATALLPVFAEDILGASTVGLGLLRAAPAAGALVMAFLIAHRPLEKPGRAMMLSVVGFGLCTVAFGLSRDYWLSLSMLVLLGAMDNVSVVVRGTLVQTLTPDHMRGRVGAVNTVFISSSNELGAFESGATAALFGPVASVVGGGIGTILVAGLVGWLAPALWRLDARYGQKESVPAAQELPNPPPSLQPP
ncbi:MAG: MFS transporter [Gemmataceae bacterium]|nr:MFS transporter [Gemmataceae bacterium]